MFEAERSDQEIADATGMGAPDEAEEAPEEPTPDPEEGSEEESGDDDPEEGESKDDSEGNTDEEDPDADEEEDDDGSEEDTDEEDDSDPDASKSRGKKGKDQPRTVPYSKFKNEKNRRQQLEDSERQNSQDLRSAITALTDAVATFGVKDSSDSSEKSEEEQQDEIDTASEELRSELGDEVGLDSEALSKVLRKAVAVAEKKFGGKLPKDVEDKLKLIDELEKERSITAQKTEFNDEWKGLVQDKLKKQFPSASDEMLEEARQKMEEIAFSKKGGVLTKDDDGNEVLDPYPLDYLLHQNQKTFKGILKAAPGNKSGESGKTLGSQSEEDPDDQQMVDIENLTPDMMRQREAREASGRGTTDRAPDEYTIHRRKTSD